MGVTDRLLKGIMDVLRMNDKIKSLSREVRGQSAEIRELNDRVTYLEAQIEFLTGIRRRPPRQPPSLPDDPED